MSSTNTSLGWKFEMGEDLDPNSHRLLIGGYKRGTMTNVLCILVRPELGGSLDAKLTLETANKIVGQIIHTANVAVRLPQFNAWRIQKHWLIKDKEKYDVAIEYCKEKLGWTYGQPLPNQNDRNFPPDNKFNTTVCPLETRSPADTSVDARFSEME